MAERNSGTTTPIEWAVPDDLYPIPDNGISECSLMCAGKFPSVKVAEAIGLIHP